MQREDPGAQTREGADVAAAPNQPCDTPFTTRGRGEGNTNQAALDKAYAKAQATAALLCKAPCATAAFQGYELLDVTGDPPSCVATVEVSWECKT